MTKADVPSSDNFVQYYAVALPEGYTISCCDELIFTNLVDAVRKVKEIDGARFKSFTNVKDAESYVLSFAKIVRKVDKPISLESKSSFPRLTPQKLTLFRKAIEKDDFSYVIESIWQNPRHLVNIDSDSPTILQEGTRYNALHVAARHNCSRVCQLILTTLKNHYFFFLLYPYDESSMRLNRKNHIMDLFCNMPDKSAWETPIHFAVKFGCLETLEILLSYPYVERDKANKYGKTPSEMICERMPSSAASDGLKANIAKILGAEYYVPAYRDLQEKQEPVIGNPLKWPDLSINYDAIAADSSSLFCWAYAGPMSLDEALEFHNKWENEISDHDYQSFLPTKLERDETEDIRRIDAFKGLERIGRRLSKKFSVKWSEFWPVLNEWADLSTQQGLLILENHLSKDRDKISKDNLPSVYVPSPITLKKSEIEFADIFWTGNPVLKHNSVDSSCFFLLLVDHNVQNISESLNIILNSKEESLESKKFVSDIENLSYHISSTSYTFANEYEVYFIHHYIAILIFYNLTKRKKENTECLKSLKSLIHANVNEQCFQHLCCVLKIVEYLYRLHNRCAENSDPHHCSCDFVTFESHYVFSARSFHKIFRNMVEQTFSEVNFSKYIESVENSFEDLSYFDIYEVESSDDEYYTPPPSPKSLESFDFMLKNKYKMGSFINGSELSYLDIDAYRVVKNVKIDQLRFPFIYKWSCFLKAKLSSLFEEPSVCTPASASRTIVNCMKKMDDKDRLRKRLF